MFFLIGISITVFLLFLLLVKKGKSRADGILLLWLAVILVHQLLFYVQWKEQIYAVPHLLGIMFPLPLLHGVILFLYVSEITGRRTGPVWKIIWHFILFCH